jgi:hypothetical protein
VLSDSTEWQCLQVFICTPSNYTISPESACVSSALSNAGAQIDHAADSQVSTRGPFRAIEPVRIPWPIGVAASSFQGLPPYPGCTPLARPEM